MFRTVRHDIDVHEYNIYIFFLLNVDDTRDEIVYYYYFFNRVLTYMYSYYTSNIIQ